MTTGQIIVLIIAVITLIAAIRATSKPSKQPH